MASLARRSFFTASASSTAAAKALPAPDPLALFLGRTSFGIRDADWARARALGFDAVLEEQLAPQSLDDSALEQALASRLPTLALDVPALVAYATGNQFQPASELIAATIARQIFSQRQLYETMVEFWSNHFSVFILDGPVRFFKSYEDRTAIRPHALGKFRDLLNASARSPAMLFYLDNYANAVGVAQENYARELMELHTLGVDGGYTEDDVREVARAFTGWTINARVPTGFQFATPRHDTGSKQILGTTYPAGRGIEDGQAVLDTLAAHPSTARFISTKLVRRFVSDTPPGALVDRLTAEFIASDGDIKSLLRMLFKSAEFAASADQKYKRPVELVISALRATGARATGDYVRAINNQFTAMGQVPFQWDPPDGYPDTKDYWLNTTALLNRWNFGLALAEGRYAPTLQIDTGALAGPARSPTELVDRLADRLLHRPLDSVDREALISYAAGGRSRTAPLAKSELQAATVALTGALLASDYFQYR
jgi:uncharacterized protein (DUF1800 family)